MLDEYDPHNMLGVAMFGQPGYVDPPTTFTDPGWHRRVEQAAKLDAQHGRFAAFGQLELRLMRTPPLGGIRPDRRRRAPLVAHRHGCTIQSPVYGLDLAALCIRTAN